MARLLAGIETEYGLAIQGRSAHDQLDDAADFVRSYPGKVFVGWDYRFESPRQDLRGYSVERLQVDPVDLSFERERNPESVGSLRADHVLANGARFYNDHGHPEYATPECSSLAALVRQDLAGEYVVWLAAKEYERAYGRSVAVYKNNTDFHGASYGTHESYLAPRSIGFGALMASVLPMLICRTVVCGAGKVGSEAGGRVDFQLSQRADFLTEVASVDTLHRRPIFNTRDEPHADPSKWMRLHVISGDANRIPACTLRKAGLVQLALELCELGEAPVWEFADPVRAMHEVSRKAARADVRVELRGRRWTTLRHVFDSYLDAAERFCRSFSPTFAREAEQLTVHVRALLEAWAKGPECIQTEVDWAAKLHTLETYREGEGLAWDDPALKSIDLEYHRIDPSDGLFEAMVHMGEVEGPEPGYSARESMETLEPTRAGIRGLAVQRFSEELTSVSWSSLEWESSGDRLVLPLDPEIEFTPELGSASDVVELIQLTKGDR